LPPRARQRYGRRFFDATAQATFLYRAIEQTVLHDLREEIEYLLGLDRARARLRDEIDWPGQSLDLFINTVRHGGAASSKLLDVLEQHRSPDCGSSAGSKAHVLPEDTGDR
jgi:hypothetical protein